MLGLAVRVSGVAHEVIGARHGGDPMRRCLEWARLLLAKIQSRGLERQHIMQAANDGRLINSLT